MSAYWVFGDIQTLVIFVQVYCACVREKIATFTGTVKFTNIYRHSVNIYKYLKIFTKNGMLSGILFKATCGSGWVFSWVKGCRELNVDTE